MVTLSAIQGVGGNAIAPKSQTGGVATTDAPVAPADDRVEFSEEAHQAATAARLAAEVEDSEYRRAKVEESKQRIQDGAYRVVSIVNVVAQRISGIAAM